MKKTLTYLLTALLLLLVTAFTGKAQHAQYESKVTVYYRVNLCDIEPDYLDNARSLTLLDSLIERYRMNIDSVSIIAYASPEGHFDANVILSRRRAAAMRGYLKSHWPDVDFGPVTEFAGGPDFSGLTRRIREDDAFPYRDDVIPIVSDWGSDPDRTFQRLKAVRSGVPYAYIRRYYLPWMRTATTILIHYNASVSVYQEAGDSHVVTPDGGLSSRYLRPSEVTVYDALGGELLPAGVSARTEDVLPPLVEYADSTARKAFFVTRAGEFASVNVDASADDEDSADANASNDASTDDDSADANTGDDAGADEPAVLQPAAPALAGGERTERVPVAALTTNLLYDSGIALTGFHTLPLTVGFEIPVGQHWSVYGDYLITTPWHAWNHNAECVELMHADIGGRWYPGTGFKHPFRKTENRRVLEGWYTYAAFGMGYYDFERNGKGYQGEEFLGSVGVGYSLVFGPHLSLNFGLGVGPLYTHYRYYEGRSNNEHLMYQYKGKWQYFGITDAKVTLTWLFYRERKVKGKGNR